MDKVEDDEIDDFPEYLEEDPGPIPVNIYKVGLLKSLWYANFNLIYKRNISRY